MRNYITATQMITRQMAADQFSRYMSGSNDYEVSTWQTAVALAVVFDMDVEAIERDLSQRVERGFNSLRMEQSEKHDNG